jgi:hypothetical protein
VAFRSPAGTSGLPVTPAGSPLPALPLRVSQQASATPVRIPAHDLRPFPVLGSVNAGNPLCHCLLLLFACSFCRHSPSGLSSLWILAFRPRYPFGLRTRPAQELAKSPTLQCAPISVHSPPSALLRAHPAGHRSRFANAPFGSPSTSHVVAIASARGRVRQRPPRAVVLWLCHRGSRNRSSRVYRCLSPHRNSFYQGVNVRFRSIDFRSMASRSAGSQQLSQP